MDTLKAVFEFPDGHTPVPTGDRVTVDRDGQPLFRASFSTTDMNGKSIGPPELPILAYGEIWHVGWDIPTNYAVDSRFRCYMNDAHGHPMYACRKKNLLELASKSKDDFDAIRTALKIEITEKVCPHCNGTGRIEVK